MHPTAYENCVLFYTQYIEHTVVAADAATTTTQLTVVEFGSYNVNGSLRPIFAGAKYIGIDMSAGPDVDIVCSGEKTPLDDGCADVVLSSSNLEHDECFWMTFAEMCRVSKVGGYLYINAPSAGEYHGYPTDCWRFYADAWAALVKWAGRYGYKMEIVESYVDERGHWRDNVGVFRRTM